jgi:putative transposase
MIITRAYKTELDPNQAQRGAMVRAAGTARFAYNWGYRRIEAFLALHRLQIPWSPIPSPYDLHRELNALKQTQFPWMYEVSKCAPQEALINLGTAYGNMWSDLKDPSLCRGRSRKHRGGCRRRHVRYVRPKARKDGIGSFRLTGSLRVEKRHVQLPRIGRVRLEEKDYLPAPDRRNVHIISATLSERAGRWFVSLQVREERPDPQPVEGEPCGVDLGSHNLATLDDGKVFNAPKGLEKNLRKLRRIQRSVARKRAGSENRRKAGAKVARLHFRIANIRRDAIHKVTTKLAKTKPVISVEDLDVRRMMESENTQGNRHLADAGLGEFHRQLDYKSGWYGSDIEEQPAPYTTRRCSECHKVGPHLSLSVRTFECEGCGFRIGMLPNGAHGRDVNGARNLKPRRRFVVVKGHEVGLTVDGADACQSRDVTGSQGPVPDGEAGINGGQG